MYLCPIPLNHRDILLDMLEQAKKKLAFDPENYNLKIEAFSNG